MLVFEVRQQTADCSIYHLNDTQQSCLEMAVEEPCRTLMDAAAIVLMIGLDSYMRITSH